MSTGGGGCASRRRGRAHLRHFAVNVGDHVEDIGQVAPMVPHSVAWEDTGSPQFLACFISFNHIYGCSMEMHRVLLAMSLVSSILSAAPWC